MRKPLFYYFRVLILASEIDQEIMLFHTRLRETARWGIRALQHFCYLLQAFLFLVFDAGGRAIMVTRVGMQKAGIPTETLFE